MTHPSPPKNDNMIRQVIRAALERRSPVLERRVLDAWRVLNGAGDRAPPGLTLDRYGTWLVLSAREHLEPRIVEAWAEAAIEVVGAEGLVLKVLRTEVQRSSSAVFAGALPSDPIRVREDDAVFLCDLDDGISTGLFLDQHDTRPAIRPLARDAEVLNLFAYTCSFSVHAALGGARRVTSVDVSKRALRRGRENMAASRLDPDRHRWFDDDVLEHLARLARRPPSYGLVIADPPVYGHGGGRTFSLEADLQAILAGCVRGVAPGGTFVFSTHAVGLTEERLIEGARAEAAVAGRSIEVVERLGLPSWDHPAATEGGPGARERASRRAPEDRGRGEPGERASGRRQDFGARRGPPVRAAGGGPDPTPRRGQDVRSTGPRPRPRGFAGSDDRGDYLKTLVLRVA